MVADPSSVEQAVSRALRDNLESLQRTANQLHQAVADMVAACASSRPANVLPPMLRAQAAAASLAAALEVLSRFITAALQPASRTVAEQEALRLVALPAPEPPAPPPTRAPEWPTPPPPRVPVPMAESPAPAPTVPEPIPHEPPAMPLEAAPAADMIAEGSPPLSYEVAEETAVEVAEPAEPPLAETPVPPMPTVADAVPPAAVFDLATLSPEEQELHRRANRVAKVSMQDIKMLRPDQVQQGREHKDLCVRLRDDLEKAHKEYDRRFRAILGHPVDYFYYWMVEILADGDPQALGEYPYSSSVLRR